MEANKLYVANISFNATEDDLRSLFEAYGTIEHIHYAHDRDSGQPRGFGFITMASDQQAQAAINALNGKIVNDRELFVSVARPREEKPAGNSRQGGSPDRREQRRPFTGHPPQSRPSNFRPRPAPEPTQAPRLDGGDPFENRSHDSRGKDTRRNTVFRTHDEEWPKGHKPKKRFDSAPKRKSRNWDEDDYE